MIRIVYKRNQARCCQNNTYLLIFFTSVFSSNTCSEKLAAFTNIMFFTTSTRNIINYAFPVFVKMIFFFKYLYFCLRKQLFYLLFEYFFKSLCQIFPKKVIKEMLQIIFLDVPRKLQNIPNVFYNICEVFLESSKILQ